MADSDSDGGFGNDGEGDSRGAFAGSPALKEGWMFKKGKHTGWKRRWFTLLRGGALRYRKTQSTSDDSGGTVPLIRARLVVGKQSKKQNKFPFQLFSPTVSRTYELYCETEEERNSWSSAINGVVEQLKLGMYTSPATVSRRQSSGSLAGSGVVGGPGAGVSPGGMDPRRMSAIRTVPQHKGGGVALDLSFRDAALADSLRSSKFSAWRQPLSLRGLGPEAADRTVSQQLSKHLQIPQVAAVAVHDRANCMVVGSCGVQPVLQSARVVSGPLSSPAAPQSSVTLVRKIPFPGGCTSLSWRGTHLLVGSHSGRAELLSHSPDPSGSQQGDPSVPLATFAHDDYVLPVMEPSPARWLESSRVRAALLNPGLGPDRCLTLVGPQFFLWSSSRPGAPFHSSSNLQSPLLAAAWNPLSGNEFTVAGLNRSIHVYDSRKLLGGGSGGGGTEKADWKVPDAHDGGIMAVAWSPHVSNWVATGGGDDGCVKIWDMRFGSQPVRTLRLHTGGVTSVAWCPSRPDVLLSGGLDRTVRLWNLRIQPHHQTAMLEGFFGTVAGVAFSPCNPLQFMWATSEGEMVECELLPDLVKSWVGSSTSTLYDVSVGASNTAARNSADGSGVAGGGAVAGAAARTMVGSMSEARGRGGIESTQASADGNTSVSSSTSSLALQQLQPQHQPLPPAASSKTTQEDEESERRLLLEVEQLLYLRDIKAAHHLLGQRASWYWQQGRYDVADRMLRPTNTAAFASVADNPSTPSFSRLLSDLCFYVPTTSMRLTEEDEADRNLISLLKVQIALNRQLTRGNWAAIRTMRPQIREHLGRVGEAFDGRMIGAMVQLAMAHDYRDALEVALEMGTMLRDSNHFDRFAEAAQSLFYPTVYDALNPAADEDPKVAQKGRAQVTAALRNPKATLGTVELLLRLHDASELVGDAAAARVMEVMAEEFGREGQELKELKDMRKVLPATVHRLYYNTLLSARRFDELYVHALKVSQGLAEFEFAGWVTRFLDDVALPRFLGYLDECTRRSSHGPFEVENKIEALRTVISTVFNASPLPGKLVDELTGRTEVLTEELRQSLSELAHNPQVVPAFEPLRPGDRPSGANDALVFCDRLQTLLEQLQSGRKKKVPPPFEARVKQLADMVARVRDEVSR